MEQPYFHQVKDAYTKEIIYIYQNYFEMIASVNHHLKKIDRKPNFLQLDVLR